MGNALVVRSTTQLARGQKSLRAAQYVRMSTDHQRYSIQNQAAAIAAYALTHSLKIVRTYSDEGQSGLTISRRLGLAELINDVQSGRADFDHILVYDVSRWGRFQDIDESAYYEFICRQAKVRVAYCAEQFDNDGSLMSNIVKNIKRVMAAEYSRELSTKVHAGACRLSGLGFRQGGTPGFGLRRELIDEDRHSKGTLEIGQRKCLQTDRVVLRAGPLAELDIVRGIFNQFVQGRKSVAKIARQLNESHVANQHGRPWTCWMVYYLLKNENYIGNILYNRRSFRLRQNPKPNPPDVWIRSEGRLDPIVDPRIFRQAQRILATRYLSLPNEEMLKRLRILLKERGHPSKGIIDEAAGLPCATLYQLRFGSLRSAYRLIGFTSSRDCEYIDSRERWAELNAKLVAQAADEIKKAGGRYTFPNGATDCLLVNKTVSVCFRVARWCAGKKEIHSPHWSIGQRNRFPAGWIVAIRLAEKNTGVLDYVLLLTTNIAGPLFRFSEKSRTSRGIERFEQFDALLRSLIRRVTTTRHASPTKTQRLKRAPISSRSKRKSGRGGR